MYKIICDICGQEITEGQAWSKYKLKKETISFTESWWEPLHIHDDCYHEMCEYIRKKRDKNQNEKTM